MAARLGLLHHAAVPIRNGFRSCKTQQQKWSAMSYRLPAVVPMAFGQDPTPSSDTTWGRTGAVLIISGVFVSFQLHSLRRARCSSASGTDGFPAGFPPREITLYQYQSCPYCSKARAFLDYYGLEYKAIEVHPIFKKEIKFSKQRKVPFIVADGQEVHDSSLLVSVLKTAMENNTSVNDSLALYPELSYEASDNKTSVERANKYFVMMPDKEAPDTKLNEKLREEKKWREWVDTSLVVTIPPNIYRTLAESFSSFGYFSSISNFSAVERFVAKYCGGLLMYFIGKRLAKKRELDSDVRLSLYRCCDTWVKAIGSRKFMGGKEPNLADLAVYGVLSAIEGLEAYKDVLTHTKIGPWYKAVQKLVREHHGKKEYSPASS